MKNTLPLIAAIEAGGTKFNLAVGTGPNDLRATGRIETKDPQQTLRAALQWLASACRKHGAIKAIGVGTFGPVDLEPSSATYGYITTTPKPGWQQTSLIEPLHARFQVPVAIDTDVNAAAIGEFVWGAGRGIDPLVYITVGTGIGGGVIIDGKPLHGLLHPEIGHLHIPVPHIPGVVQDQCVCPYHHSCLEGFASGTAIATRWGVKAHELPANHPAHEEVAQALAHGVINIVLTLSPRRIILGGGVMKLPGLIDLVRSHVVRLMNGYVHRAELMGKIDEFLVLPQLGDRSGVLGALALGMDAYSQAG
jgi:fructokinase